MQGKLSSELSNQFVSLGSFGLFRSRVSPCVGCIVLQGVGNVRGVANARGVVMVAGRTYLLSLSSPPYVS